MKQLVKEQNTTHTCKWIHTHPSLQWNGQRLSATWAATDTPPEKEEDTSEHQAACNHSLTSLQLSPYRRKQHAVLRLIQNSQLRAKQHTNTNRPKASVCPSQSQAYVWRGILNWLLTEYCTVNTIYWCMQYAMINVANSIMLQCCRMMSEIHTRI